MAKILVAASPKPREIIERVLAGHELFHGETMATAEELLRRQTFDLIICTVVFDESRMLDFLRVAKSRAEWRSVPFVCARVRGHVLTSPIAIEAVEIASRSLGAAVFLNVPAFRVNPEREMRDTIERLLTPTNRKRA